MKQMFSVAVLPVLLAGCAATYPAQVTASRDPSDIHAEVLPTHHHSPMAGYNARVPIDPKPWRKLNDDVSSEGDDAS
jgi:hypothetical protein